MTIQPWVIAAVATAVWVCGYFVGYWWGRRRLRQQPKRLMELAARLGSRWQPPPFSPYAGRRGFRPEGGD